MISMRHSGPARFQTFPDVVRLPERKLRTPGPDHQHEPSVTRGLSRLRNSARPVTSVFRPVHEYDTALKSLLKHGRESFFALTSAAVDHWHNVEMLAVSNRRVDLLGEASDGRLIHIELQSTNDPNMALRMLEYCAAIGRQFGRFPEQVVLYVGEAPLRMTGSLSGPNFKFECRIVDIRELDGERLLESDRIEDNVIAVLARVNDRRETIKHILSRIAAGDPAERGRMLAAFIMLAGLRRLEEVIEQEASQMPLLDDIMDNKVLGREFKRGELAVLIRLAEKRFGSVPAEVRQRLAGMSIPQLESAALRLLDARSVEELLG